MTKETFERYVPAFRDCADYIWNAVQPFTVQARQEICGLIGCDDDGSELLDRAAALRAAYDALPQLDLILTENGFAVVSNQNLAPASRQRVDALREQLRRDKSDARDRWTESRLYDGYVPGALLYTPTLCRRYGLSADTYEEEFLAVQSSLSSAAEKLKIIISPEMYDSLLEQIDAASLRDFIEACRHFLAAYVRDDSYGMRLTAHRLKQILLESNPNDTDFAPYRNSSTYSADTFEVYQNKRDDPCYFF